MVPFKAKTAIHLPVKGGRDEGYVMGREGEGAGESVKAWLMSTAEMCLLSTELHLQGSE